VWPRDFAPKVFFRFRPVRRPFPAALEFERFFFPPNNINSLKRCVQLKCNIPLSPNNFAGAQIISLSSISTDHCFEARCQCACRCPNRIWQMSKRDVGFECCTTVKPVKNSMPLFLVRKINLRVSTAVRNAKDLARIWNANIICLIHTKSHSFNSRKRLLPLLERNRCPLGTAFQWQSFNMKRIYHSSINPKIHESCIKIVLAVISSACLTLPVNAPEGCFTTIETVNGKVSFFDVQFGRDTCKLSP
jgi:hypothetical protein